MRRSLGAQVLNVQQLSISFSQYASTFAKARLDIVDDLSLAVHEGEIVAVVGASGSGKSLLAHAIMGILPYNAVTRGKIFFKGEMLTLQRLEKIRGRDIALVPQGVSYLDPLLKVGPQLRQGRNDAATKAKCVAALARYGLDEPTEKLYPFELSGGMARRVLIATAVMNSPALVIADEPTPGLHADAARQVLGHLRTLADDGAAVLLITHDLELMIEVADRIVVLYAGTAVEEAPVSDFNDVSTLRHPYTRALWRAMPANGFRANADMQPDAKGAPGGCRFGHGCPIADGQCADGPISYRKTHGGKVRCVKDVYGDTIG